MSKNTVRRTEHFARVPNVSIPRSKFDLSHGYKTTLDGGWLVPVQVLQMVPGDSVSMTYKHLCRMTTPIVPFMDNVHLSFFTFFVPNRLVWDNWEDYITGSHRGKLGTTHTRKPTIKLSHDDCVAGTLANYFGIINNATDNKQVEVDALPFRAFQLCYDEWFRDENLIEPVEFDHGDTVTDKSLLLTMRRRGKRKDYFSSALPWVQKGPSVGIPVAGYAPVTGYNGDGFEALQLGNSRVVEVPTVVGRTAGSNLFSGTQQPTSFTYPPAGEAFSSGAGSLAVNQSVGVTGGLFADLGNTNLVTINNLRESFAIQHVLERDARNGSRYCEQLLAHWGVTSPDMRLQRPEYVGGYTTDFMVNSVAQTSGSTSESPQGNLAAVAKSSAAGHIQYSSVEHGILITMCAITTDLTYQQGINRNWFKFERMDEFFPEFAHLGEQPIFEKEIFADGSDTDNAIFGYQERFAELRYFPSLITGKLNSTDPLTLDYWHLAQVFNQAPSLSQEFIEEHPPFERVLAVQDEPQFVLDMWMDLKAIRPLPMFSVPSLLDHF